jgi:GT2 family glycosyltransferase
VTTISVVVPTYRRPGFVARTLASLAAQELPPNEVLVVDNAADDETAAVVARLSATVPGLRRVVEPRLGVSAARNRGAAEARAELVAFLDDDAVASAGWLQALAGAARDLPGAVALAGPIHLRWSRRCPAWLEGLESWYGHFDLGPRRAPIAYPQFPFASNLAFRRAALQAVGGFPVELGPRGATRIANEEDGLFRRLHERGWPVAYEPGALVYHWVHEERLSRRYLLRRSFTQGRSDVVVDDLFATRPRARRAGRAMGDVVGAVAAGVTAVTGRRDGASMRALVAAGTCLGSAVQEARLGLVGQRRR